MNYGEKIKQLRLRKGLTQAELGRIAFNVSDSAGQTRLNRIESGHKFVTTPELEQLQKALGVGEDEFIGIDNTLVMNTASVTVADVYPEFESLQILLKLAVDRDDAFLKKRAWEALQKYAELQLKILNISHTGRDPCHKKA